MKRLPAVRSLSHILPKGTEGGKEFARIVDILLFHRLRRESGDLTLLNDASGDYAGLDSFSESLRRSDRTGYQYKFYPSPLSDAHRANIRKALVNANEHRSESKIAKWIIVTPDDLTSSAVRSEGGDIKWIEALRNEWKGKLVIEHWGHTALLSMFLETPSLLLYYYL